MLNNGGIASPGHFVTFSPNEINEQPNNSCIMPLETQIINVKKTRKKLYFQRIYRVRRFKVKQSLKWLKNLFILIPLLVMKGYNRSLKMDN